MTDQYDIVIVGGGMVGAAIACALGHSDYRIALIESHFPESFSSDQLPDLRVSALNRATEQFLHNLQVWEGIKTRRLCPYRRLKAWEISEQSAAVEFNATDIQTTHLGHIVENRITQLALLERVKCCKNITLICPARVAHIDYSPGASLVMLDDDREIMARLLVGADGANSQVRTAANITVKSEAYPQHALIASVETQLPQQDITWQQFTPTGPLAFLPLSKNHASLVWYHHPENVEKLLQLSDTDFLQQLHLTFPAALGLVKKVLQKGSFPLKRQHAQTYVKEGLVLVGDAAHSIHPLAGQGVNLGFMDAAMLAEVLLQKQQRLLQDEFYSLETLMQYEQARRQHNALMIHSMDAFYKVFSPSLLPLKLLRNIGLGVAARLPLAKEPLARYASGLHADVPAMARVN